MSVETLEATWRNVRGIKPAMRLVLVYLAHRQKDGKCFPSIDSITRDTGLNRRTVQRNITLLCQSGWISRDKRKTHAGDGWNYVFSDKIINSGAAPSSIGGYDVRNGRPAKQRKVATTTPNGGAQPPDSNDRNNDIECDMAVRPHTQDVNYDVEQAISIIGTTVPRSFIEERARRLKEGKGLTDKGVFIPSEAFPAHCKKWWKFEREKDKYSNARPSTGRKATYNPIPMAKNGEDKECALCDDRGCVYCVQGHICEKGYLPPDQRKPPYEPNAKLKDGSYRSGCFKPQS